MEFSVGSSGYKVIRGIKPNLFEIYKDGVAINEASHSKEFQKILEQNILKLNHKSFHQIVVLGSSSFIPFMQLTAAHRREVIEDLLDINIFSKMNSVLKENIMSLKEKVKELEHNIDISKSKIEMQRKYIYDIKNINQEKVQEKQNEIENQERLILSLEKKNEDIQKEINEKYLEVENNLTNFGKAYNDLDKEKSLLKKELSSLMKEHKFFLENDVCPTCTQDIDTHIKESKQNTIKTSGLEIQKTLESVDKDIVTHKENIETLQKESKTRKELLDLQHQNSHKITWSKNSIEKLENELKTNTLSGENIKEASKQLDTFIDEKDELVTKKLECAEDLEYHTLMGSMLKDTGIKTKIIKQYLPVMNRLINQYLQTLDFFVHFDLDESFNETIRSRHRDAFSYDSFSEGEKQRIDLALLFTWRQIAKMKNSISTNLLILDETFDSSLDNDGVENLMKIIYSLGEDTNIFIISHKGEILEGRFKSKIEFFKEKNFSKMR